MINQSIPRPNTKAQFPLNLVAKDWTFECFDGEEYARIRKIARQTGRFGIMSAFLSARRKHQAMLQASLLKQECCTPSKQSAINAASKQRQEENNLKIQQLQIAKQESFAKPNYFSEQEEFKEQRLNSREDESEITLKENPFEGMLPYSQKGRKICQRNEGQICKDQKQNIKRWKQEKAKVKKMFSTYQPDSEHIKCATKDVHESHHITKATIALLYQVQYFGELNQKVYVQDPEEDPFFLEIYKYVFHLVKVDLLYPPQEVNLSKIRTFIVRKILDDFVSQQRKGTVEEEIKNFGETRRRMTKQDREDYQKARIAVPKSRIDKSYLLEIFSHKEFASFYKEYVQTSRLSNFLKEYNQQLISKLQQNIYRIQLLQHGLEEKVDIFKKMGKRPVATGNLSQYQSEAKLVLLEYFHQ